MRPGVYMLGSPGGAKAISVEVGDDEALCAAIERAIGGTPDSVSWRMVDRTPRGEAFIGRGKAKKCVLIVRWIGELAGPRAGRPCHQDAGPTKARTGRKA